MPSKPKKAPRFTPAQVRFIAEALYTAMQVVEDERFLNDCYGGE